MTLGKKEFGKYSVLELKTVNIFVCLAEFLIDEVRIWIYLGALSLKTL